MAQQPDINSEAGAEFGEPELTLATVDDDPDPRMLALVRLLARRAARGLYEQQMKDRRTPRA